MAATELNAVLSGAGNLNRSGLLTALEGRGVYVVKAGENPAALNPGSVVAICHTGLVFFYDAADALTAHDGVTCIVTADGKRYKTDAFRGKNARTIPVTDKDLTAPPGSPTLGATYIVAAGGTGAWAGKDKNFASWTARGWVFVVPNAYDFAIVIDESALYHYSAGGAWTSGYPFLTIGADTISPSRMKYTKFGLTVVNQTTNAPPGSPADGNAYVIGGSPTGAWTGKALQIAIYEGAAWVYYPPAEGYTAFDAATNTTIVFDGAVWQPIASAYVAVTDVFTAAQFNGSVNLQSYSYSATTAPTTATNNEADPVKLVYTARAAGAILEIAYEADFFVRNNSGSAADLKAMILGIQIDATAAMADWGIALADAPSLGGGTDTARRRAVITFRVAAPDTASHTYTLRWFAEASAAVFRVRFSRRRLSIRERS